MWSYEATAMSKLVSWVFACKQKSTDEAASAVLFDRCKSQPHRPDEIYPILDVRLWSDIDVNSSSFGGRLRTKISTQPMRVSFPENTSERNRVASVNFQVDWPMQKQHEAGEAYQT